VTAADRVGKPEGTNNQGYTNEFYFPKTLPSTPNYHNTVTKGFLDPCRKYLSNYYVIL